MQRTWWWTKAIWLGVESAIAIWFCSGAIVILGAFLIGWGPVAFLQRIGLPIFLILLACTSPLWIIGGLLWLVGALRSPDQQERRSRTVEDAVTRRDRRAASDVGERGRAFRRSWSRRLHRFEESVVNWFVLRPALLEQRFETADRGSGFLRRYLRGWLLGSISLFGMLAILGQGARAKIAPGDTSLYGYFVAVTLLEFALAACLCSVLLARYVVTRVLLTRVGAMAAEGDTRSA